MRRRSQRKAIVCPPRPGTPRPTLQRLLQQTAACGVEQVEQDIARRAPPRGTTDLDRVEEYLDNNRQRGMWKSRSANHGLKETDDEPLGCSPGRAVRSVGRGTDGGATDRA